MKPPKIDMTLVDDPAEAKGIASLFLDSGAFSLFAAGHPPEWFDVWEDSGKEFREYLDKYAAFVKKHKDAIDLYATVDVIGDAQRTFEALTYLQDKGLDPMPVVHCGSDLKWLRSYVFEAGYDYVGFGGLAGRRSKQKEVDAWVENAFAAICPADNDHKPVVKVHGFGIASPSMLVRYPWYSTDSVSPSRAAGFGLIWVPTLQGGRFRFTGKDFGVHVSDAVSTAMRDGKKHVGTDDTVELQLSRRDVRKAVTKWLDEIGLPFGRRDPTTREVVEKGVTNSPSIREKANLVYIDRLCRSLPEWPWPFRHSRGKALF